MWMRIALGLFVLVVAGCGDDDDDDDAAPGQDAGADAAEVTDAGEDAAVITARLELHARGAEAPIESILWMDPFDLVLSEAPPGVAVTLRAHRTGWASEAVYTTDADGEVHTATDAATDGTFTGVEPDGLVWSMQHVEGEDPDLGATMDFEAEIDGQLVARVFLSRLFVADGVVDVEVDDPAIVGTLYLPPGAGPFPAVLLFGGSEGGTFYESVMGPYLASKGYAVLGVAYHGAPGVPADLFEIPLEYFDHALSWLAARPEVDAERIGVFGASRGGELALLLGAKLPIVHAVVANVPSGVMWGGLSDDGAFGSAWTEGGEPLPFIQARAAGRTEPGPDDLTVYIYRGSFEDSLALATPEELAAATIEVERTQGPILMVGGDADELWPSCTLAEIADARLAPEHAQTYADEYFCYPEAGHLISFAGGPTADLDIVLNPDGLSYYGTGGTPRGNGLAARAFIDAMLLFLEASLGE